MGVVGTSRIDALVYTVMDEAGNAPATRTIPHTAEGVKQIAGICTQAPDPREDLCMN